MSIFNFWKGKKVFHIDQEAKQWVEDNLLFLLDSRDKKINDAASFVVPSISSFPKTYSAEKVELNDLIDDLSSYIDIERSRIDFQLYQDMRDSNELPLVVEGEDFISKTIRGEKGYLITISKSLLKEPPYLFARLALEFTYIFFTERKMFKEDEPNDEFLYVAGVSLGFGVILSNGMGNSGYSTDGFWENSWRRPSDLPDEIMAYCMAYFSHISGNTEYSWKSHIPRPLVELFDLALDYIKQEERKQLKKV